MPTKQDIHQLFSNQEPDTTPAPEPVSARERPTRQRPWNKVSMDISYIQAANGRKARSGVPCELEPGVHYSVDEDGNVYLSRATLEQIKEYIGAMHRAGNGVAEVPFNGNTHAASPGKRSRRGKPRRKRDNSAGK